MWRITIYGGVLERYSVVKTTKETITFIDPETLIHRIEPIRSIFWFWGNSKEECKKAAVTVLSEQLMVHSNESDKIKDRIELINNL